MEVSGNEISDVIEALDITPLLAHHVGDVPTPKRLAPGLRGLFDPNLDDK